MNGVPQSWVDHTYLFGLWWMNHSYQGEAVHANMFDSFDDCCIEYLDRNGVPPAIPEWDGWRHPSNDDLNRFWYQDQLHSKASKPVNFYNRGWLPTGGDPFIRLLNLHNYPDEILILSTTPNSQSEPTLETDAPMAKAFPDLEPLLW